MRKKIMTFFLVAFMVVGALSTVTVSAETWQEYLTRQWGECETKFSALNKNSGLTPWDGTVQEATDSDGDGLVEVSTPAQFRWAVQNKKSLSLMNDIDMGGQNKRAWAPVVVTEAMTIEGNNKTIYNLYITGTGGAYNSSNGLALLSYVDNPNFYMKNLTFRYAEVRTTAVNYNYAVAIAYFKRGHMEHVGVEDSLVKGGNFTAGLVVGWDTGYIACNGDNPAPLDSTGTTIDQCHTTRVYTYGASCIGNFAAPLMGSHVSNSYAVDGITVSTGGHSGGFVSCPGYNFIENCFCNITMYGYSQTAVFSGVSHYNNKYVNCYASGVVEGVSGVGGFVGYGADQCTGNRHSYYENCYSTTMVGMQNAATNMGGFVGYDTGFLHFKNCYAAGEVGTLTTNPSASGNVGGFGGIISSPCTNCYYDKQMTAMRERVVGNNTNYSGITGQLTADLQNTLPNGYSADTWSAHEGLYPQLKVFSDASTFNESDQEIVKAYSVASVCTAQLYPSNEKEYTSSTTDYDTVRSIRYLFPLTNNALVDDQQLDVSWEADDIKSTVSGMEHLQVISLKSDTYAAESLAPGIGWLTVYVKYYPDPANKEEYTIGKRRLRMVPTTTLSVASAIGVDSTIWVIPEGAKDLPDSYRKYDHRNDVNFCLGDSAQLQSGNIKKEAFPADNENFTGVGLTTVGGEVNVTVEKQKGENWEELELTDELKELLLGKRVAEKDDLGVYRMTYRWYASGSQAGGAYLESSKKLTVLEAYNVTYKQNDGSDKTYKVDPGAYAAGQHVTELPDNPTRTGYTFAQWNTNADGSGTTFDDQSSINGNTTVYAMWTANKHNITYQTGDDPDNDETIEQETDKPIQLPDNVPEKPGYSFVGWTPDPDGTKPYPDLEDKTLLDLIDEYKDILDDEDITFHAVWEKNPSPSVTIEVTNKTDPGSDVQVKDVLEYTITATNKEEGTKWNDVKIQNTLSPGLTLVEGSIYLVDPDGKKVHLDEKDVYNESTHTIEVPIELIKGKENYVIVYDAYVNTSAVDEKTPENHDISNKVTVTGENPDGSETTTESDSTLPNGGDHILLADPKPNVNTVINNQTRPNDEKAKEGDTLEYTITVSNEEEYSVWSEVDIEDILPEGLTLLPDTIWIEYPDGHKEKLDPKDVYDEETHKLKIKIDEIYGGEDYKIIFDVKINEKAKDPQTGEVNVDNKVIVNGKTPGGQKTDKVEPDIVYPKGWDPVKDRIETTPNKNVTKVQTLKTGDQTNIILWLGVFVTSGFLSLIIMYKRKRILKKR